MKESQMIDFEIAGRKIGRSFEPFIVAEISANHGGDIEVAKKKIMAPIIRKKIIEPNTFRHIRLFTKRYKSRKAIKQTKLANNFGWPINIPNISILPSIKGFCIFLKSGVHKNCARARKKIDNPNVAHICTSIVALSINRIKK